MSKIDHHNIYGFNVEKNFHKELYMSWALPSSQNINANGNRLSVTLATASNLDDEDHEPFFQTLTFAQGVGLETRILTDSEFNGPSASELERNLARRMASCPSVQTRGEWFFYGPFDEPHYVILLAQSRSRETFGLILNRCLQVASMRSQQSLANGKHPNYRIQVPKLIESLEENLEIKIETVGLPEIIEGYSIRNNDDKITKLIEESNYVRAIVQPNGSSFTYDQPMQRLARQLTRGITDDLEKSEAIFRWVTSNIHYGRDKRQNTVEYRGAMQVFYDREGVCGESAALQVTLERLVGNMAFLVEVGTKHAVAGHLSPRGEIVLVDTTDPNGFNVKYTDFKILSDDHSLAKYW
ncbi:transglutaminase domain-containing protein [Candidatus Woesearchaeota archaeon]|nr:transglutaminase domain-containing protein [Candidatus Woesearchaeota archaeon]